MRLRRDSSLCWRACFFVGSLDSSEGSRFLFFFDLSLTGDGGSASPELITGAVEAASGNECVKEFFEGREDSSRSFDRTDAISGGGEEREVGRASSRTGLSCGAEGAVRGRREEREGKESGVSFSEVGR